MQTKINAAAIVVLVVAPCAVMPAGCDLFTNDGSGDDPPDGIDDAGSSDEDMPSFEPGDWPMEVVNQGGSPIYLDCDNELTVTVPLVDPSDLVLDAGDGTVSGERIVVDPATPDEIVLRALRRTGGAEDESLRERRLPVRPPPPPGLSYESTSGEPLVNGEDIEKSGARVVVRLSPEPAFASSHPDEATYRLTSVRASVRRGGDGIKQTIRQFEVPADGEIVLGASLRTFTGGDLLILEAEGLERVDADGDVFPVELPAALTTLALVIR